VYAIPYIAEYYNYTGSSASVPVVIQDEIETVLSNTCLLGITVSAASSVTVNHANLTATVYVNERYVAGTVNTAVEDALNELFSIENIDFGKEVPIGKIYKTAMNVPGVDYITVSLYEMRNPSNVVISTGALPANEILRKGTFSLTASGGIAST
jgi:hypothetical protein